MQWSWRNRRKERRILVVPQHNEKNLKEKFPVGPVMLPVRLGGGPARFGETA